MESSCSERYKLNKTDWQTFKEACRCLFTSELVEKDSYIINCNIINEFHQAAKNSVPKCKPELHNHIKMSSIGMINVKKQFKLEIEREIK